MRKKIVITGASGIVGRALLKKYLDAGCEVIALSRKPPLLPGLGRREEALLTWEKADVSLPAFGLAEETWAAVRRQTKILFHLAARTDFKDKNAASYLPVNLAGVQHALRLAEEAGAPFHHVSTAFVCGTWQGLFRENNLNLGQEFRNGYEESKNLGESFLQEAMQSSPLPVTIHRPGIVVENEPTPASGKTFGPFLFLDAVARLREGAAKKGLHGIPCLRVLGNRRAHLPLVFAEDVAEALMRAASLPESAGRVLQLVAPRPVGNDLLEEAFNAAFGLRAACFAESAEFAASAANGMEALLAKKTQPYAGYLDLRVRFSRENLDDLCGGSALPTPNSEALGRAFAAFLAIRARGA
ncbi:SDR family oxidoreductase [Thiovibrio sp. JS02]